MSKFDKLVIVAVVLAVLVALTLLFWVFTDNTIKIQNGPKEILSPLTGEPCPNATRRPIAVMFASDTEARPLSGISKADIVFEMPVTPNGITRIMAVFQCDDPTEVGSIRSARGSFIPLVQGLKALYAHWGGERDALTMLDNRVADNVDALKYEGTVYYRKNSTPRPHNGFTTLEAIRSKATDLGYTASSSLPAYPHLNKNSLNAGTVATNASVSWAQGMSVSFRYDPQANTYKRWRGGTPEIDATTKQQVSANVVVIIKTNATFLYDQYISVKTVGQGRAAIYQNGKKIECTWKKLAATDMITFVDSKNNQIPLTSGPIWMLFDAPLSRI